MAPRTRGDDRPEDPKTEDLLARFRDGDESAFDELVGAFEARLVQFFYRLCWDRARAEDFAQQVFLKLLRGVGTYTPEGKLATYVFRIATNVWIDHYRAARPRQRLYSLDQAMSNGFEPAADTAQRSPLDRVEHDEERARLKGAIERLTEPHRLVFELAIYQELPYAEVAEVLGIPVGTVKSRMHNSVKALKEFLAERERSVEEDTFRGPASGAASG